MQVLPIQGKRLVKALSYCHFTNPISDKLLIAFSEKLDLCPKLLAHYLIQQIENLPCKNSDPTLKLNFLNKALLQCENISDELKIRIATKISVSASAIH